MSVATKRKELSALTSQEVGYLLCQLGLDKHVGSFQRFGVDGVVLAALKTEKDLEGELGMASHVQRVNLISHVKEFVDKKGVPVDLLEPVRGVERTRALRISTTSGYPCKTRSSGSASTAISRKPRTWRPTSTCFTPRPRPASAKDNRPRRCGVDGARDACASVCAFAWGRSAPRRRAVVTRGRRSGT